MTNQEWIDSIGVNQLARVYRIYIQNITPSLEDSIALLQYIKTFVNNPESMPEIEQLLYKNFPVSKDQERIKYVFSAHENEEDNNTTPAT